MVEIVYVNEEIRYDKTKLCGWSYRQLKYRVDYKSKKRKTRFVTYKGYCQRDYERYSDNFVEEISIHAEYTHFPFEKPIARLNRKVREGWINWKGNIEYKSVN